MDASFETLLTRLDQLSDQFRELKEGVQRVTRCATVEGRRGCRGILQESVSESRQVNESLA